MVCPGCGEGSSKVLESRIADAGDAMRRRRECLACAERFTTYERIEQAPLWVVKRDGRSEPFSANKLLRGLAIACSKREVTAERLETLVADVERALRDGGCKEVSSDAVGERALAGLVRIDEAAAIRFASVIQGAASLHGFRTLLTQLELVLLEEGQALGEGAAGTDSTTWTPDGPDDRTREPLAVA